MHAVNFAALFIDLLYMVNQKPLLHRSRQYNSMAYMRQMRKIGAFIIKGDPPDDNYFIASNIHKVRTILGYAPGYCVIIPNQP